MKKKVGRPRKGLEILADGWQDIFLAKAKEGCAIAEIATHLNISRQQMYELRDKEKEFADTFTRAKDLSYSWWLSKGRENMENRDFNNALWAFNMKNRFRDDWGDSSKVQVDAQVNAKVDTKIELVTRSEVDLNDIGFKDS